MTATDSETPVSVDPDLVLSATTAVKLTRLGYLHELAHYEPIYQASARTIKGWLAIGRAAKPPDLPPYDEPAQMAAWYARNKKNRVPDRLVQLAAEAARLTATATPAPPDPAASCGNVTTQPPGSTSANTTPAGSPPAGFAASVPGTPGATTPPGPALATGFSATLERLRSAEAIAGAKYTQLILEGKDDEAAAVERRWQKLRSDLRDYERDAQKVLSAEGKLWPADEVVAALYEIHTVLLQSFDSLYDRIETELRTLPREEAKRLYRAETARLRAGLVANKFTALPAPLATAA